MSFAGFRSDEFCGVSNEELISRAFRAVRDKPSPDWADTLIAELADRLDTADNEITDLRSRIETRN